MYNSRPRRMSYEGFGDSIAVPENYGGSAFREAPLPEMIEPSEYEENVEREESPAEERIEEEGTVEAGLSLGERCEKKHSLFGSGFGFRVPRIFGEIGFEELLIIGLIFLIAQSENNEDIIVLLALLLFIG